MVGMESQVTIDGNFEFYTPFAEERNIYEQAPSTKFSVTKNTSVMLCSKRPTPPTF